MRAIAILSATIATSITLVPLPVVGKAPPAPPTPTPFREFKLVRSVGPDCSVFLPDSRTLLTGGGWALGPGEFRHWDVQSGQCLVLDKNHKFAICSIAVSPDGKTAATGGGYGEVKLWDVATGKAIAHLDAGSEYTDSVAFSPDGTLVANGGDQSVRVWDVKTHKLVADFPGIRPRGNHHLTFSPDGKTLVVEENGAVLRFWDTATWKERPPLSDVFPRLASGVWGQIVAPDYSPDGALLAVPGGYTWPKKMYSVKLLDAATLKTVGEAKGHTDSVLNTVFTPDRKYMISGSLDKTIKVWTVPSCTQVASWVAHGSGVRHISISRDGKILASCGDDNVIRLWELPKILGAIKTDPTGPNPSAKRGK